MKHIVISLVLCISMLSTSFCTIIKVGPSEFKDDVTNIRAVILKKEGKLKLWKDEIAPDYQRFGIMEHRELLYDLKTKEAAYTTYFKHPFFNTPISCKQPELAQALPIFLKIMEPKEDQGIQH